MTWIAQTEREIVGPIILTDAVSNSTSHNLFTVKQRTYLNFRVEGVAWELKTYLVIALKNTMVQLYVPHVRCVYIHLYLG